MKAMFLCEDRWHTAESLKPLCDLLFDADEVLFTTDPAEFMKDEFDVLVTFKDPIENNQIPTPPWCDEAWTEKLLRRVQEGMGLLAIHAALADIAADHPIVTELFEATFITHPAQCPVRFEPLKEHPILHEVEAFDFPQIDEHYVMQLLPGFSCDLLAETVSEHGRQPALWIKDYGNGRVCMYTPGHDTPNLTCPGYVKLMQNMLAWVRP